MEVCRVCLSTEKGMQPLDETFIVQYNLLTNLNISVMDGMPQFTCATCVETVKYFKEFRDKSIASETTLREIFYTNLKSEGATTKCKLQEKDSLQINEDSLNKLIKTEIKEEIDIDSDNDMGNFEVKFENYNNGKQHLFKHEVKCGRLKEEDKKYKDRKTKKIKEEKSSKSRVKKLHRNSWLCGICPEAFKEKIDLNNHIDVHKDQKQCELCKEKVNCFSQLLAHRLIHVGPNQQKCHICNKRYRACLYLEHHYREVHIHQDGPNLICSICSTRCTTPKKLNSHMLHVHSTNQYFCDNCSKRFTNKTNLKAHMKRHALIKSYVCDLCGFSCHYSQGLKDHKVRQHSLTKLICKDCSRAFGCQQEYERHKCNVKIIICPVCGLQLKRNARLVRHMARHSDVAQYECDRCPAKYKTKGALLVHINRHDGNRTRHCEFCPAKFYSPAVLIKHRRTHTGEKPYVCKVCNKGFTGNNNLKVHMKVHGEYLIVKKVTEQDLSSLKNNTI